MAIRVRDDGAGIDPRLLPLLRDLLGLLGLTSLWVGRTPEEILEVLRTLLVTLGHQVSVAGSAAEAIARARELRPTLILTDIGLPEIDGFELAVRLRDELSTSTPPIIALTGFGQSHDRERSARAGFFRHLVKPVDVETLIAVIREAGGGEGEGR